METNHTISNFIRICWEKREDRKPKGNGDRFFRCESPSPLYFKKREDRKPKGNGDLRFDLFIKIGKHRSGKTESRKAMETKIADNNARSWPLEAGRQKAERQW